MFVPMESTTGGTVIGSGSHFKGEIIGKEELTIEGKVEGKIQVESIVHVNKGGGVWADVTAQSITISGAVTGNIVVSDKAEIIAGGFVVGDIKAPRVVINDGARILGRVEMDVSGVPELS